MAKKYIIELTDEEFEVFDIALGEAEDHAVEDDDFDAETHLFNTSTYYNTLDAWNNIKEIT